MSQLKSHSMVITDLDWDPNRTELLASASIDGFVNIWDYQDSRSPLAYLNCMVPCSQV